jgi:tRNA A-37 threonylcarbamoyl transferase component Bud32
MLFAYPNDYRLEGLRIAADHGLLSQALSELSGEKVLGNGLQTTLVRYRPEDRAVLLGSIGDGTYAGVEPIETQVYFKIYSNDEGKRAHRTMRRVMQFLGPRSHLVIPRVLGYLSQHRLLILGAVPGTPLSSLVGTSKERESFARVGESLATLHAHRDAELPRLTLDEYRFQTERTLNRLRRTSPPLRDQVQEIKRKLAAWAPKESDKMLGFVHADLLPGNILVDATTIGLLDLGKFFAHLSDERWRGGERADDGSLREAFLESYARASGRSFAPRVLRWWTATAVIRRVGRSFRQLKPDKLEAAEERLRAVAELLDGH